MSNKQRLIVIGNGMAGIRTIDELLKLSPEKYDITVFGAEPYCNYNRIMLSPVLAGDKTIEQIILHDFQWYQDKNIQLHTSKAVIGIDPIHQTVIADDGSEANYDKLILATGSNPIILPLKGKDLDGVITFRDIDDVNIMIEAAKIYKKAVVIGGGLLGLEAANGLMIQGMDVTVVQRGSILMNQQLDQVASDLLQAELEQKGLTFLTDYETTEFIGRDRVEKVLFSNGIEIEADLVVVAVGIHPNIALAQQSGIMCKRGVLVDERLKTYSKNIYAVGECVQYGDETYGLVAPLYKQAKACAAQLVDGDATYQSTETVTKLKVTGINLFSVGDFNGDQACEILTHLDPSGHIYKKLVLKENKIIGILLYGDISDGNWYFSLLSKKTDVSAMRENIIFGKQKVNENLL
ncbi:FAD-dependent oxidoreductase [Pseudomonadota bacterium]|nr:FAD-dependent oxidoreductase [Pseudomonadota bacterium]